MGNANSMKHPRRPVTRGSLMYSKNMRRSAEEPVVLLAGSATHKQKKAVLGCLV